MNKSFLKQDIFKASINKNIYLIFFIYLLVGLFIYKDFGLGIEEHFQRKSGFYWLNYILNFTEYDNLKELANFKFQEIESFTPNITNIESHKYYGVIFDLPLAFIEVYFDITGPDIFYLRHLLIFLIFFISGILFYRILEYRFQDKFISSISSLFYLLSPKIFGSAFFDGKDILFLSLMTINFYFLIKYYRNSNTTNLIYLALFSAFSTSTRILGIIIPVSFIFIIFFEFLNNFSLKKIINIIYFILIYLFFLYLHWPFLWDLNLNLSTILENFKVKNLTKIYFDGTFYNSTNLPYSYVPKSIFMSTPVYILSLFVIGYIYKFKRVIFRLINISPINVINNDLWKSIHEKLDLFYFLSFLIIIIYYFSFTPNLTGGWRIFLFCNFFICYFAAYTLNLFKVFIKNRNYIFIIKILIVIMSFELIYKLYVYHPYQSLYVNNFISKKKTLNYEIDTQSISRVDALRFILSDAKEKNVIKIGTASFTPLEDARSLINTDLWNRFLFLGTNNLENADYIYSNHIYDIDTNINNKYLIPKNFILYKIITKNKVRIYSIYKKKI